MDRALIERMVGAVVLVLLLVVLAPALLDGRLNTDSPELNQSMPPETERRQHRTEVIILNAPRDPVSEPANTVVSVESPINKSAPKPSPKLSPKPILERAPTGFAVQLGSFAERGNAERYATQVRAEGFSVFIGRAISGAGPVYRVYSGPQFSRAAAEQLAVKLRAGKHSTMVVDLGDGSGR
jgi:DedD protein